jgi:uncharacterized membrane protein required for colicin V production
MILTATLIIMLAVAYAQYRNGLFGSCAMLVMVLLSGLVAFNLWEPVADTLDASLQNGMLSGCEDMIALAILFGGALFGLRVAVNYLCPEMIAENGKLQHFGGAAVGLLTGYLVAGFLICAMQTLPLDVNFLDFEPRQASESEPPWRTYYPSDRVWLALMRHAGAFPLGWKEDESESGGYDRYATFDRHGTFELRYLRYRRTTEARGPMPYFGEFDPELGRRKKG